MCVYIYLLQDREISALLNFSSPLDKLHVHIETLVRNSEWSDTLYFL